MNRYPPPDVIRKLCAEVRYCCPVKDCGNPYLTFHHFDPPWHTENHHNPDGMIALCLDHHKRPDAGAFTIDQLRELKKSENKFNPQREFDWMRNSLLLSKRKTLI